MPAGPYRHRVIIQSFTAVSDGMQSGYLLRDVINQVNAIHFEAQDELFTLGHLYESMSDSADHSRSSKRSATPM